MGDQNLNGAKSFVRDVALKVGKPGRVLWVNLNLKGMSNKE
jgi:hypothetical protein